MAKYFLISLFLLVAGGDGDKFLNEIALYQKDSYYKQKVYDEHNWKSFSTLPDVNKAVDPNNYDLHLLNAAVFFATNKIRSEKKQKELTFSAPLRDAAVVHSQQMVDKKFFSHFGKTPKLKGPDDRMRMFGIGDDVKGEGENIDYNHMQPGKTTYWQIAEQIVDDFMHSSEHRKTMLSKGYSHLGCAAVLEANNKDGLRYYKATQDYTLQ